MFLGALEKQNPALIECAVNLIKQGEVLPDTYLIDVDQFRQNAANIQEKAQQHQIKLYAMTKQFGRNPYLAKLLIDELGYEGIVCVDYKEALHFHRLGIKVSHIGHLVQPPAHFLHQVVNEIQPEVITLYSLAKARQLSLLAQAAGYQQDVLLKFYQSTDTFYPNQESGFPLNELEATFSAMADLPNLTIVGITHFPCFLYDREQHRTEPTVNLATAQAAMAQAKALGYDLPHFNLPSSTNCETIPLIAAMGGTHGEPGHGLTGTMPANWRGDQPEKIAMLYATEISHQFEQRSYCYGGGSYSRSQVTQALVFEEGEGGSGKRVPLCHMDASNIDYYFQLEGQYAVGSPVVMAFRTQIFVTRSDVALIEGLATGKPNVIGIFDSQGRALTR